MTLKRHIFPEPRYDLPWHAEDVNVFTQRTDCAVPWGDPYRIEDSDTWIDDADILSDQDLDDLDKMFTCPPRMEFPWAVPPPALPFMGCYIPAIETQVQTEPSDGPAIDVVKGLVGKNNPCDWKLTFKINALAMGSQMQPMEYEVKSVGCEVVNGVSTVCATCYRPGSNDAKTGAPAEVKVYIHVWGQSSCSLTGAIMPDLKPGTKLSAVQEHWHGSTPPATARLWATQTFYDFAGPAGLDYFRNIMKKVVCTTLPT